MSRPVTLFTGQWANGLTWILRPFATSTQNPSES